MQAVHSTPVHTESYLEGSKAGTGGDKVLIETSRTSRGSKHYHLFLSPECGRGEQAANLQVTTENLPFK